MTFGATTGKPWSETLPACRGAAFTGRTFCRFHMVGSAQVPSIAEIWATPDHVVEGHAHESDELLYVLSGSIEINGRVLGANDTVFIPRGESYRARVMSGQGSHVLRIAFTGDHGESEPEEYESRLWRGGVTMDGFPDLSSSERI